MNIANIFRMFIMRYASWSYCDGWKMRLLMFNYLYRLELLITIISSQMFDIQSFSLENKRHFSCNGDNSTWSRQYWLIFTGLDRKACQHSCGPLVSIRPVPDSRRYSRWDGPSSWNSRKCSVQESNLVVRSNSTRPGRICRLCSLPAIRNITTTNQRTMLGGLYRRISSSLR